MHWIVARLGFTETLVLLLVGLVWLIYLIWGRQKNPPRGRQRWGTWIPLVYCVYGTVSGLHDHWFFYRLLMTANAFNEAQAELFWRNAVWGAARLLLLGILGTAWIRFSLRRDTDTVKDR